MTQIKQTARLLEVLFFFFVASDVFNKVMNAADVIGVLRSSSPSHLSLSLSPSLTLSTLSSRLYWLVSPVAVHRNEAYTMIMNGGPIAGDG